MPGTEPTWTIAELADEFQITHRTIRYYEHQGLINPQRRGSQRVFHGRDRVRLALVLRGKRLGFDLAQIRRIVDMYDEPPGEAGQLRYLLDQIAARRSDLEQRRHDIEQTLRELADVERRCLADLTDLAGPADLTPAERTPAELTVPAERTRAELTPAERTPAERTPAERTPAGE